MSNHKEHGSQFITYNNLKNGFGCKYCGREKQATKRRLKFEEVKEIFSKNDMELLDQEYINTSQMLKYICRNHPEYGVQYMCTSNAYKQHCPHCNVIKGEKSISQYLLNHNIQFETQKTFEELKGIGGKLLRYDFYIPNKNLLIGYQGEQHEKIISIFGGKDGFEYRKEHDKRKRDYAENQGIELLEIWYYDHNKIEEILDNKLFN